MAKGRYQKILVPIDGSEWSRRAVPHAVDVARSNGSELILLHVFRPPAYEFIDKTVLAGQQDQIAVMYEQVEQYSEGICEELHQQGIDARKVILEGANVASLILDYVATERPDLIVMTTHGRTGLARFLFGSVAQKIIEAAGIPVMLIRPDQE